MADPPPQLKRQTLGGLILASRYEAHITGEIYNHRMLWHSAMSLQASGTAQREGSYHKFLAASLFTFFAFEAFLNFIGERVAPDEWKNEKDFFSKDPFRGAYGKLRLVAERVGYTIAHQTRPDMSLRELADARFHVVHARTEKVDEVFRVDDPATARAHVDPLMFRYGEEAFSQRMLEDAEAIADALMAKAVSMNIDFAPHGPRAFRGTTWVQGGYFPLASGDQPA